MKQLVILFLAGLCLAASAQNNATTSAKRVAVVTTNMVTAHPDFRIVNGKLYNIKMSKLWSELELQFLHRTNSVTIAKKIVREPIYEDVYFPPKQKPSDLDRAGLFTSTPNAIPGLYSGRWEKVKKGETKKTGPTITLRNFTSGGLTTEAEFKIRAIRVGTQTNGTTTIEVWDCGTPNTVRVVTTNFSRAKP